MKTLSIAIRRLARVPGFAIATVLTVALAVGTNGIIFSAVRGLLIRPLPLWQADRVVWVYGADIAQGDADRSAVYDREANALRRQRHLFEAVAVIGDRSFVRHVGAQRMRWRGLWVTPSLLDVLHVQPAAGRAITIHDARSRSAVMMISYERWTRDLGGDPSVIGQPLRFIDNKTFTVVGVLPPALEFPQGRPPRAGNGAGYRPGVQDFWILGQQGDELPGGTVVARLQPAVPPARASAEAAAIPAAVADTNDAAANRRRLDVVPMRAQALGLLDPGLRLAQGCAALMLLLAAANLTNLSLIRLRARRRELAILSAVGAPRSAIARAVVAETTILSAAGGMMGLGLAASARGILRALSAGGAPMLERVEIDWMVALFTLAATVIVALLVSLVPAIAATRTDPRAAMAGGGWGHAGDARGGSVRAAFVISQVAIAMLLSIGAGLIARSFTRLMAEDTGYQPAGVITADIEIYDHPKSAQYYRDLHRTLLATPGVEAVGLIHATPLTSTWRFGDRFEVVGRSYPPEGAPRVAGSFVAFDYFAAMRIPILAGRAFTAEEYMDWRSSALIINESAARRFFPEQDPIGQRVHIGKVRTIVGVVKDSRDVRLDAPAEPTWYQPVFGKGNQLIVRTSGDEAAAVAAIRRVLLASDPNLVIESIGPFRDVIASTVTERRMAMRLLAALAGLAVFLASVGLYGVMSFSVKQRMKELGVRSALGASPAALRALVLRSGLRLSLIGLSIGLLLALASTRVLRGLLYHVSPTEPSTILQMAALLFVVSLLACGVPAWGASRVSAAVAMRSE